MCNRSLVVAFGFGLLFAGPALAASQQDWDACQSKDPARVIPACSSIIPDTTETPQSRADAYVFRAGAYIERGNIDGAIRDYTEAIKLTPRNVIAYVSRALAYFHKGDRDKAILDYAIANKLDASAVAAAAAGSPDVKEIATAAAASPPPPSALAFVDQLPVQSGAATPAPAAPEGGERTAATPATPPAATPGSAGPESGARTSSTPLTGAGAPSTAAPAPESGERTAATPAAPPTRWNSVAASIWKVSGRVHVAIGYSGTRSSADDARSSAVQACRDAGGKTCKATGAWNSGCVYITTGSAVNRAGWGSGDTVEQALSKCRGQGLKCKQPIGGCLN